MRQWLQNQDSYGAPVAFTFRQNKSVNTACGGFLTLFHISLALAYFAWATYVLSSPSWNVSTWNTNGVDDQGFSPLYYPQNKMVPTMVFGSSNQTALADDDILSYFTVIFQMTDSNGTRTNISAEKCDQQKPYGNLLVSANEFCPKYEEWQKIGFQSSVYDRQVYLRTYVSTCINAAPNFNKTECKSQEKSEEMSVYLTYHVFTYTEVPSGQFADGSTNDVAYAKHPLVIGNSLLTFQQLQVEVIPVAVTYAMNWFYAPITQINDVSFDVTSQVLVTVSNEQVSDSSYLENTIFDVKYRLSTIKRNTDWSKSYAMAYISDFAGLMSLTIFGISFFLAPIVDFSTDLQLITKLFTVKESAMSKSDAKNLQDNDTVGDLNQSMDNEIADDDDFKLRVPFEYPLQKRAGDFIKNNFFCCCQCCYCCKQSKQGNKFDKARDALYSETDIIEVIQTLRLVQFLITGNLKPRHYTMISFFQEYQIDSSEDNQSNSSESDDDNLKCYKEKLKNEKPSFQEKFVLSHLEKARKERKNFSRREYFEYKKWRQEQNRVLALHRILQNIDPNENKLDVLALNKVTGKQIKGIPQVEVDQLTNDFKQMLFNNIDLLKQKDDKYKFLQKLKFDTHLSKTLRTLSHLKLKNQLQNKQTLLKQKTINPNLLQSLNTQGEGFNSGKIVTSIQDQDVEDQRTRYQEIPADNEHLVGSDNEHLGGEEHEHLF